jgi:Tfp pilus assembly protein PilN
MKLNLLPATVSRGKQTKTALVVSVLIAAVAAFASAAWTIQASSDLAAAKTAYDEALPPEQAAVAEAQKADAIMSDAKLSAVMRNVALANAMVTHNDAYPDLYQDMLRWIPPFYRLTSISAQSMGADQSAVTLTGTLQSYQQYADLMLVLMRNPKAVSVSRSGFQSTDLIVPSLVQADQVGRPRLPGESPIPDDPLERLAFFESQGAATPQGYTGVGNFGSGTTATRAAMPGESLVTVQIVVNNNLQTPDPRSTLSAAGGAGGGTGPGNGFAPTAPPPGPGPAKGTGSPPADQGQRNSDR